MLAAWSSHPPPGAQECEFLAQQPVAPKGGARVAGREGGCRAQEWHCWKALQGHRVNPPPGYRR